MSELEDRKFYIQSLYNEYLEKTENRNPSYGEIIYIDELDEQGLDELETEIIEELGDC